MKQLWFIIAVLSVFSTPALAQKSTVTASNHIPVDVNADDFSGRFEYTAPAVNIQGGGFYLVAAIKKQGVPGEVFVTGTIFYSGDWRFYNQVLFRGGDKANAILEDRKVISCAGSRYGGGCSHSEGFEIRPTQEQITKYAANDFLEMQVSAGGQYPVLLRVPVAYLSAVKEVSAAKLQ